MNLINEETCWFKVRISANLKDTPKLSVQTVQFAVKNTTMSTAREQKSEL